MKTPMRAVLLLFAISLVFFATASCEKETSKAKKPATKRAAPKAQLGKSPHIVLINVSGLRADRVGATERNFAPFINEFAKESVLFQSAYANESYTLASVASLFTGLYPHSHQALYAKPKIQGLHEDEPTLASELGRMGYLCSAIVSGAQVTPPFKLNKGFKNYQVIRGRAAASSPAASGPTWNLSDKSEGIFNALEATVKKPSRPLFLYMHFGDTQMPCLPPPPFHLANASEEMKPFIETAYALKTMPKFGLTNKDFPIALYDGAVSYVDHWVEKSLDHLAELGIDRSNSIIIITSDHGQELLERHPKYLPGTQMGRALYNEQIQIPLIISMPEKSPKVITHPVELVDVPSTVLQAIGRSWNKKLSDGRSLLPAIDGNRRIKRVVYSGGSQDRGMIINGIWKYIESDMSTRNRANALNADAAKTGLLVELYNWKTDPAERNNTAAKWPGIVKQMKEYLEARRSGNELPAPKKPASKPASAKVDHE